MIFLRIFRDGLLGGPPLSPGCLLGGPPLSPGCLLLAIVILLGLLGCGVVALVDNVATLGGVAYWAAQTGTPRPTVTVFLGTTTPVYAATPAPAGVTTTPGVFVTETPPLPVTTTPSLNLIGLTTPQPTETPYYRVGSFYMNSDVYVGGPNGLVFRVTGHETQASPRRAGATYHFITVRVTNYSRAAVIVPVSDVLFIRHVEQGGGVKLTGRWTAQNEPLVARGLPSYDAQQLEPLPAGATRAFVVGFVVPDGAVRELGLITNWTMPVEGGLPVWFFLEDDPLGPFVDAVRPPPPTPVVLDEAGTYAGSDPGSGGPVVGTPGPIVGRWPTTGAITRGFGCHEYYTGISGAGWGCPEEAPWFHNGVDIANSTGTAIVSPVDGTMQYAGPNPAGPDCAHIAGSEAPHEGLGNYQRLAGGGTLHYFGHLSSFAVTAGDVATGQTVAGMGSTGCSTGPHLHWIVYQGGNLIDPAVWAGPGP